MTRSLQCWWRLLAQEILGFTLIFVTALSDDICEWDSGTGVSFDLSRLQLERGGQLPYYKVSDSRVDIGGSRYNFSYQFNVCNQVLRYPMTTTACTDGLHETCTSFNDDDEHSCETKSEISGKAFGYQVKRNPNADTCYVLSGTDMADMSFSLLEDTDPAKGVMMSYTGGEFCGGDGMGGEINRNRELHISFLCYDDAFNIPDEERVMEIADCVYEIQIHSIYGCPSECGTYENALCGKNGLCDYDWTNKKAMCFCYFGWNGGACDETTSDYEKDYSGKDDHPHEDEPWVKTFEYEVHDLDINGQPRHATIPVTYDLSAWHFESGSSIVLTDSDGRFTYYFNLFGNVDPSELPAVCYGAIAPCDMENDPTCANVATANKVGSIFQVNADESNCHLLGTFESSLDAGMLLPIHGTGGVHVVYVRGGWCERVGINRKFTFTFVCPDSNRTYYSPQEEKEITAFVEETGTCEYFVTVESAYACPWQCLTETEDEETDFSVCNAKGICAADPWAKSLRCLCDEGWTGDACDEKEKKSSKSSDDNSGYLVAIIVVSILVVLFVGSTVYLYMRNRSLQRYTQQFLDDEPDDVVLPPFHTEPQVPDDLVDSASDSERNDDASQRSEDDVEIEMHTEPMETFVGQSPQQGSEKYALVGEENEDM